MTNQVSTVSSLPIANTHFLFKTFHLFWLAPIPWLILYIQLALTIFGICEQHTIDWMVYFLIWNKVDQRYQLRRNNNGILLERPRLRTKKTLGDRALSMAAPFLWNSLPLPIRQETSIDSFKRSVKTYLFKKAFS